MALSHVEERPGFWYTETRKMILCKQSLLCPAPVSLFSANELWDRRPDYLTRSKILTDQNRRKEKKHEDHKKERA